MGFSAGCSEIVEVQMWCKLFSVIDHRISTSRSLLGKTRHEFNRTGHDFDPDATQLQALAPEKNLMTLNKASEYSIDKQI